jgi:hypothetical protein
MATLPTVFSGRTAAAAAAGDAQRPLEYRPVGLGGAIPAIDALGALAARGRTDLDTSLYGGGRGGTPPSNALFRDGGPVGYALGGEAQRPLDLGPAPVGGSFGGPGGAIPAISSLGDFATSGREDLASSLYRVSDGGGRGGVAFMRDGGSMGYAPQVRPAPVGGSFGGLGGAIPAPVGGSFGGPGGAIPAISSLGDFATSGREDLASSLYRVSDGGGRGGVAFMRDGGSMGFRPLGMQAGGVPVAYVAPDVRAIFQGLVAATQSGSTQDVAAYIESNRRDLNDMVSMMMLPQGQADFITNTINSFAPPSVPQMNTPPQGMRDFPGYEPETGDFYPPQQQVPQQMPAPSYPSFGDVEEGDQYIIDGAPPPGSAAPIPYDPNEIGVANGGYITRNMNRGGLMSLRRG